MIRLTVWADMGRKLGTPPHFWEEVGPYLTHSRLG